MKHTNKLTFMACPSARVRMWIHVANFHINNDFTLTIFNITFHPASKTELSHCLLIAIMPLQLLV